MLTYKQVLKEMEKNDFVELFLTRKHRDPKENYSRDELEVCVAVLFGLAQTSPVIKPGYSNVKLSYCGRRSDPFRITITLPGDVKVSIETEPGFIGREDQRQARFRIWVPSLKIRDTTYKCPENGKGFGDVKMTDTEKETAYTRTSTLLESLIKPFEAEAEAVR